MIRLHVGTLGNANLYYPPDSVLEDTVTFDGPVSQAKAVLRGFELGFAEGERRLGSFAIDLRTGFGDRPNEVKVFGTTRFRGDAWSPTTVLVHYTLVAE